jgi:MFS family permease
MQTNDSESVPTFPNERGNVARLAVAQALAGANATIIFATGAVVGNTLAPDQALATLPVTVFVIGTAAATLPAGALAQRFGRRMVFMLGTGCGVLVGLLASMAVLLARSGCTASPPSSAAPTWPSPPPSASPP